MHKVYFTNFGYYSFTEYATLEAAIASGKRAGFEFSVSKNDERLASWTVFGGLRYETIY